MKKIIFGAVSLLAPVLALAATNLSDVDNIIGTIRSLISQALPIIIALAVLVLMYGILKFIMSAGEEEKREEGKKYMLWGIIGLAVMVSIWGLVNILTTSANLTTPGTIAVPTIPIQP
jgi:uncharacterized membrane protein YidH (DUF202 family)